MSTLLSPRVAYALWAETYVAEAHNPLMVAEEAVVGRILAQLSGKRALDVGTGSGRYLPLLAARAASVVGVDLSMAMLERGTHRHRICGDACHLPFRRGAFDLVNASLMVGDVTDLGCWTREIARVMAAGGHLVYSDFHPSWSDHGWERTFRTADGVQHAIEFTPHTIDAHLAALTAAGFSVLAIREPRIKIPRLVWRRVAPVVAVFHAVKDVGVKRVGARECGAKDVGVKGPGAPL
jgi:malonyl-CoA O-methyltransferase